MNYSEILTKFNVPYKTHSESQHVSSGWIGVVCPFCGVGSDKYGLGFNQSSGAITCWKCGPHGFTETLMALTGEDAETCYRLKGGLDFAKMAKLPPRHKLVIPPGANDIEVAHEKYLRDRGLDPDEIVRLWKVQGFGRLAGRAFRWRLFIPIYWMGEIVSWTTRAIGMGVEPRYRSARPDEERVNHHELLFGEDYVRHAVIVHEGPFDVFRMGPGSVCTFGTSFSHAQVAKLARYPKRAVCFDNDREAQKRAKVLVDKLSVFPGETYHVEIHGGKDVAEAPPEEVAELREAFFEDV